MTGSFRTRLCRVMLPDTPGHYERMRAGRSILSMLHLSMLHPYPEACRCNDGCARDRGPGRGNPFAGPPGVDVVLGLVFLAFLIRLVVLIDRYAVNVFHWDQWDFLDGLFRPRSLSQ